MSLKQKQAQSHAQQADSSSFRALGPTSLSSGCRSVLIFSQSDVSPRTRTWKQFRLLLGLSQFYNRIGTDYEIYMVGFCIV